MSTQSNKTPHKGILKINLLSSHERAKLFGAFLKGWLSISGLSTATLAQKLSMDIDLLMDILEGILPVSMIDDQLIDDLSDILAVSPALFKIILGDVRIYPDEIASDDLLYKLLREGDIAPWFDSSQSLSDIEESLTSFWPEMLLDEAMFSDVVPAEQEDETQGQCASSLDELRSLVVKSLESEQHRRIACIKSSILYLKTERPHEVSKIDVALSQLIEELEKPHINDILENVKNETELHEEFIKIYNVLFDNIEQEMRLVAKKEAMYRQKQQRQSFIKQYNFTCVHSE